MAEGGGDLKGRKGGIKGREEREWVAEGGGDLKGRKGGIRGQDGT